MSSTHTGTLHIGHADSETQTQGTHTRHAHGSPDTAHASRVTLTWGLAHRGQSAYISQNTAQTELWGLTADTSSSESLATGKQHCITVPRSHPPQARPVGWHWPRPTATQPLRRGPRLPPLPPPRPRYSSVLATVAPSRRGARPRPPRPPPPRPRPSQRRRWARRARRRGRSGRRR